MSESVSDATLLERFVDLREEDAFAALVRRHGPSVLSVCRRFLRNEHDVEDVFQSTFLVLASKAPRIAWHESAEPWLRNVARRLALHARTELSRRCARERFQRAQRDPLGDFDVRTPPEDDPGREAERNELKRILSAALEVLPEKYRAPVVLCYLEGKTNEEAARQLGWPAGSMSRRLERGRTLLRRSLAGQGVALTIGLICAAVVIFQSFNVMGRRRPVDRERFEPIQAVMAPFAPKSEGGDGLGTVLARLVGGPSAGAVRERVPALADRAERVAADLEQFDPGRDRVVWRAAAAEMRTSAQALSNRARVGDELAMIAAARRLDATCVRCHAWFHADDSLELESSSASGLQGWPPGRWLDRMN